MSPALLRARICLVLGGSALASAATTSACEKPTVARVDAEAPPTPPPPPPPTPPPAVLPTNAAALASARSVDAGALKALAACAADEIREVVCGVVPRDATGGGAPPPFSDCTPTGVGLTSYGESSLKFPFAGAAHDPTNASFRFDALATASYRPRYIEQTLTYPNAGAACCFARCAGVVRAGGSVAAPPTTETCVPIPRRDRWVAAASEADCPSGVFFGQADAPAPFVVRRAETCCYTTYTPAPQLMHPRGRPLRIGDANIVAPCASGEGWAEPVADLVVDALPGDVRRRLAVAWADVAAVEHASVAAFAKLTLELLAFGAPEDLVSAAQQAGADEVRHARDAYALASVFGGSALRPGPLAMGALALETNFVQFACNAFAEGCVDETLSALEADEAARVATAKPVARVLRVVARDEARHAELSWRIVAWAVGQGGPNVREALLEELTRATVSVSMPAYETSSCRRPASDLEPFGVLASATTDAVRERGLREVVLPCARALLGLDEGGA